MKKTDDKLIKIINENTNDVSFDFEKVKYKIEYPEKKSLPFFKRKYVRISTCIASVVIVCFASVICISSLFGGKKDEAVSPTKYDEYSANNFNKSKDSIYFSIAEENDLDVDMVINYPIQKNIEGGVTFYGVVIDGVCYQVCEDDIE